MESSGDKILSAVVDLHRKLDAMGQRVSLLEKRWQWITSAAVVVLGLIGGPNAVNLIAGGTPQ
ncbi:hypothetical protein ACIQMZ_37240 [Streptomyces longwoodensis]|uniref:hypothetical protein n=1 Tax=Streptomyces longwoodensis TaxID=68231 RepID=UPI0037FF436D